MPASLWEGAQADRRVSVDPRTPGAAHRDRGLPRTDFGAHRTALPRGSVRSRWSALAIAVTIQTVMIVALFYGLLPKQTHIASPALEVAIIAPPAKPPPRPPVLPSVVLKVHAPVPIPMPTMQLPIDTPPVLSLVSSAAAVPSHPVAPPAPPPPAEGNKALSFEQRLLAAVQAAVDGHYPPAARLMHQEGQADIGFDYLDGQISHIALVQSSGSALIDKAALATVRDALYPPPPEKLLHRLQHYEVWVRFRLERGG